MKKIFVALMMFWLVLLLTNFVQAQESTNKEADTVLVNKLLDQSKQTLNESPEKAVALAMQAKELAEKLSFVQGHAYALKNIGLGYYYQGKYIETLDYWSQSLKLFESLDDRIGVANLLNNIAAIYSDQGDDAKALEFALKSLEISEKTGDKLRILSALNSIGTIYYNKKATWDKALDYLLKALPLCEEIGNKEASAIISENIGEIYFDKGDDAKALSYFNKSLEEAPNSANSSFAFNGIGKLYLRKKNYSRALEFHQRAYDIADKLENKLNMVRSLKGIANVYISQKDFKQALSYYDRAENLALEIKSTPNLKDLYQEMALAYEQSGNYVKAYNYQSRLDKVKDTLFNEITEKKLGVLQFEFDLQKKQGEINLLTADKALKEVELKRQKLAKNALSIGIILILFIAFIIYRNYKAKVRINKILDKQKEQIEQLLLNILPVEVARELQDSGHATPRNYETVSVMFTDFKGFTSTADKISPRELVDELNICFEAFDDITTRYNLEKIKTIGDSYMCAGGIPTPDENHVYNIIRAGLEMQKYILQNNQRRADKGLPPWDIRIGVHVGPIVAGVVGKRKYAYDIWGSTVNIASRMESNGEPGQVNISSSTYEIIKDKYNCKYRGKIYAKNVGEIDMYFIEDEISELNVRTFTSEEIKVAIKENSEQFDIDTMYG